MAKIYIDTVKYAVYVEIDIAGLVEKPDVVGAIFGQTEGLLGDELDLRDLQKNGKIGRIEVDLNARNGRTTGTIKIPSSLDMVETSIIAASLETVDRVGPCEAKVKVLKIEDTRNQKRKVLVEKAKYLLKNLLNTEIPESKEITERVREQVKMAEVTEYGHERLSAGPSIEKLNEIIIVEGRADVINLLKNDITNVIAIGGANVPRTVVELSKGKEVTAFLDGDRGGDIILNELIQGGVELDFVARAPIGREVEELTRKEIIKILRNKIPVEQIDEGKARFSPQQYQTPRKYMVEQAQVVRSEERKEETMPKPEQKTTPIASLASTKPAIERMVQITKATVVRPNENKEGNTGIPEFAEKKLTAYTPSYRKPWENKENETPAQTTEIKKNNEELLAELNELNNTLKARLYGKGGILIKEVAVRDVIKTMTEQGNIETIVFDGIITQRLVDVAAEKGVRMIIGMKQGNVTKKSESIKIITKSK